MHRHSIVLSIKIALHKPKHQPIPAATSREDANRESISTRLTPIFMTDSAAEQAEEARQLLLCALPQQMNQRLYQHLRKGIANDDRGQPDKRDAALHQYLRIEEVDQQPCHTEQGHQHGELSCTSVAQKRQKLQQACFLLVIRRFDADTGIPAQEQGADETDCTGKNSGNQQTFQAKAVIDQSVACRTEQKTCCAEICCMYCL